MLLDAGDNKKEDNHLFAATYLIVIPAKILSGVAKVLLPRNVPAVHGQSVLSNHNADLATVASLA